MERHRFDTLSFVFGVFYTLIGLTFLLPASPFDLAPMVAMSARWVWPIAVVAVGAAILVPLFRPDRGDDDPDR